MHEYQNDKHRTDIFYKKQIQLKITGTKSAIVCELIIDQLMRQIPTYKKTGKETAHRQEHLTGDEIENVKQSLSTPPMEREQNAPMTEHDIVTISAALLRVM